MSIQRKEILVVCLLGVLLLSGCSVINFGIGVALDSPRKTMLEEEFDPHYMVPDHFMNYSSKIFTGSGVKKTGRCDGFFIKEKQSDSLLHIYPENVTVYKKDGSSLNGFIKYFGKNESGLYFRFDSKTVPFSEIDKIIFYSMDAGIIHHEEGYYTLHAGENLKRKVLHHSEIEALYLGFNVYSEDAPPVFVEVGEVEKIIYKREMSILPYALAGAGLAVDIIAGILILVL